MKHLALEIEYLRVEDIMPYKNNAKIHTPEQIKQIKASITEFGMNDPIAICGENNVIVEGHGRLIACKQLGMDTVPVIRLDHLTDEQRKAYTLAHNKLTMNTGFDLDILKIELENIDFDMGEFGFSDELEILKFDEDSEIEEDEVPKLPLEPKAKLGEIYKLGRPRLMCGDSTKKQDIELLLGGGRSGYAIY